MESILKENQYKVPILANLIQDKIDKLLGFSEFQKFKALCTVDLVYGGILLSGILI